MELAKLAQSLRETSVHCLRCRQPFVAAVPVETYVCPGCTAQPAPSKLETRYAIFKNDRGLQLDRYVVTKTTMVRGTAYEEFHCAAPSVEEARSAIPKTKHRLLPGQDTSAAIEVWA